MKKSVRFLIIAAACLVGAIVIRQLAIAFDGGSTVIGSILTWVAILSWLTCVVTAVIGLALAFRAAWRWSRTPKPPAAPVQG